MELKPTTKVAEILAVAQRSAQTAGNPEITCPHRARGPSRSPRRPSQPCFAAGAPAPVRRRDGASRDRQPPRQRLSSSGPGRPGSSPCCNRPTPHAARGDTFMSTDAPVLALAEKGAITNVDTKAIEAQVEHLRAGRKVTSENPGCDLRGARQYSTDPTQAARDGKLDPVIGRDPRSVAAVQVLAPVTKNNPVPHRRARRRQDGRRRGPRSAHRRR